MYGLNSCGLEGEAPVVSSYEPGNEPLDFLKGGVFLNQLSDY
jgi:hypothetical protein